MSGRGREGRAPSTPALRAAVPLPACGEDFAASASRLAGFAGAVLGWAPDAFWRATPGELAVVVGALAGDAPAAADAAVLARLKEEFPDG